MLLVGAGFDAFPMETELSDRTSIQSMIAKGQEYGEITMLIIPGATHVDFYDNLNAIPFEKLNSFFGEYLK